MRIGLQGVYTRRDFLRAKSLNLKRARWIFTLLLAILLASNCQMFRLMIQQGALDIFLFGILFLFVFLTWPWWVPYAQALLLQTGPNVFGSPITGDVTAEGLNYSGGGLDIRVRWDQFGGYKASHDVVVLLPKSGSGCSISRSLVQSDEDWQQVVALVHSKLPKKG